MRKKQVNGDYCRMVYSRREGDMIFFISFLQELDPDRSDSQCWLKRHEIFRPETKLKKYIIRKDKKIKISNGLFLLDS